MSPADRIYAIRHETKSPFNWNRKCGGVDMKSSEKSLQHVFIIITAIMTLMATALPARLCAAEMGDYCIMPPYVKRDIRPNVIIMMDNAVDMGNQAYTDAYTVLSGGT